ncbi:MAG TPA: ABC transporter substrate-binding protein [Solirubrobacteraceae bacterium]|nr:ABC transporter substrate-binding protein [Solirubrobacteraceae bacterium]
MRRLLLAVLLAAGLAGCGLSAEAPSLPGATLVLDFTPNAVHAGIYAALARGDDVRAGVRLRVVAPSASTDSVRLLQTGRADFAILDIHDLAIARARGEKLVGIMSIVQEPLAAVIAAPSIPRPQALAGHLVGVTGVPSDTAVLRSIVAGSGRSPARLHTITIGFNAVSDLLAGRVAAATAFWNDEGVAIRARRPGFHIFRVDRYGAPAYPELVLVATASTLRAHPALARHVVHAIRTGYEQVLADPAEGEQALRQLVPGLDTSLLHRELRGLLPAFRGPDGRVGALNPVRLRAWARWETRFGIVPSPPDVAAMFTERFLAPAGR